MRFKQEDIVTATNASAILSDANYARHSLAQIAFIRAFEAKALALTQTKPPSVLGSMHFCAGQEAVPLGAVAGLRDDDQIVCTYRGHGWAIASGLDPRAVFAEICQKAEGINGGRAGSALMMAPDTRFIGENSIVGAGTTIACGVAMANLHKGNGRVVVVTIGDGALNQGAVSEAFALAAARKLPVIFVVENNGWSEMTSTDDMFLAKRLAQRTAGYGIPSATIDGTDPIVVRDSFAIAAERARKGDGPALLECRVPRLWGHYNRDMEHYRSKDDRRKAEQIDPFITLSQRMIDAGLMTEREVEALREEEERKVERIADAVMASPDPVPTGLLDHVIAAPVDMNPRVIGTKEMSFIEAVNAALRAELDRDETVIVYGEDVGKGGGIFAASRNLQREYGAHRVFDTPIAENAILGSAVGAAMSGLKPIVEIMWADFLFVALDQLVNQASNIRYITGGKSGAPMVVRTQQGATPGSCAQHSQSIEAMLAHVPGLKVALASSATDAYALLRAASADPDPVIVIEARGLYQVRSTVELTEGAEPVGKARLRRPGKDVAIISWGTMVDPAEAAAEALAEEGIDAAVLDLRWLNPIDEEALTQAVREAGGRVLIVHEAVRTGGFAGEIGFRIQELLGERIDLSVRRLATMDTRIPASPVLQAAVIPNARSIADAARVLAGKRMIAA
ncbi:alpha-ketoacid dehydrogenase subunit alpha/beta [Sphingobium chlorophenolicum]|uniref:alpha-ketoacid dehydrogenase subunit alpha/beta n=1 Tax=Sphingobium chlorophenolicum TaxID=46429 RepID=UPI000B3288EC|nr:alpha-ketoacid dehydrogenase subunit alpha/beta [Sphingobium chlorophenolicum]